MKKCIFFLVLFFFNQNGHCQTSLSFQEFEDILHKGVLFTEKDIKKRNNFPFVIAKKIDDYVIYLPINPDLSKKSKREKYGDKESWALLHNLKTDCYTEIEVDCEQTPLENGQYFIIAKFIYVYYDYDVRTGFHKYDTDIVYFNLIDNSKPRKKYHFWFGRNKKPNSIFAQCKVEVNGETKYRYFEILKLTDDIQNTNFLE